MGDGGAIHTTQRTLVKNSELVLRKYDCWDTGNFEIFFRRASDPIGIPLQVHHLPIPHQIQAIENKEPDPIKNIIQVLEQNETF